MGTVAISMEDRILTKLASAGVDGLAELELIEAIQNSVASEIGAEDADLVHARVLRALELLRQRRTIRLTGGDQFALSHAEWAQRIVAASKRLLVSATPLRDGVLEKALERLLAGTDPQ